jgi:nucleotide-binding universal stress UspA family protein
MWTMGQIVVGVDGSPGSVAALRFALAEARLRGATVLALHAWVLPYVEAPGPFLVELPAPDVPPLEEVAAGLERGAKERLAASLREAAGETEGVDVQQRVEEGSPARLLIEASRDAELLVVGTRGRGGFAGLLLGSVSRHCLSHAHCPVAVVPPQSRS